MGTLKNVLEMIYFASAPVLVLIGIIGLRQLKIAKDTNRLNAKRNALSLSAERCQHYIEKIIPLINALDDSIKQKGIKFFDLFSVEIKNEQIRVSPNCPIAQLKKEFEKTLEITAETLAAYNAMEAFAVFFISRVADEAVAYRSVGHTFCNSVRSYLPDLVLVCEVQSHYKNLLSLFLIWNSRITSEKLLKNKKDIDSQLNQFKDKIIKPLGVDGDYD